MKIVEEEVKLSEAFYIMHIEYKSGIYPVWFECTIGTEDYIDMGFYKGTPTALLDEELDKIRAFACQVWKDTDIFTKINSSLIKRKYIQS